MASRTLCAYRDCFNSPLRRPDLTFHRFPHDHRGEEWILRCGNDQLRDLSAKQLKGKRLCSEHFNATDYKCAQRKLLHPKALPSACHNNDFFHVDIKTESIFTTSTSVMENPITVVPSSQKNTNTLTYTIVPESLFTTSDIASSTQLSSLSEKTLPIRITDHSGCHKDIKNLQNKQLILEKKLKDARKTIKKLKRSVVNRRVTVNSVLKDASKFLAEDQMTFLTMQLNHSDRKRIAWTSFEQQFAKSLYYVSPKAYNFLRDDKHFELPSITTLRQWNNLGDLSTGFNENLISKIKQEPPESMCTEVCDENTSLSPLV